MSITTFQRHIDHKPNKNISNGLGTAKQVASESEGIVATEHVNSTFESELTIIKQVKTHYRNIQDQPFPTNIHCYTVHKLIGRGAFGKVALATHKLTNK